MTISRKIW